MFSSLRHNYTVQTLPQQRVRVRCTSTLDHSVPGKGNSHVALLNIIGGSNLIRHVKFTAIRKGVVYNAELLLSKLICRSTNPVVTIGNETVFDKIDSCHRTLTESTTTNCRTE